MFCVKWVIHGHETRPVEAEDSFSKDLDTVVRSCQKKLFAMRQIHAGTPPDGFIVCNGKGMEVRRWFGFSRPNI
jgi:hypothetical protein